MRRIAHIILALTSLTMATAIYAQLRDSGQGKSTAKKNPKSTIVVRPGPPVKPTQPAKPNTNEKSDWSGRSQAQR